MNRTVQGRESIKTECLVSGSTPPRYAALFRRWPEQVEMAIKADRNSSHLAGEYFVAAELYRRGYSVAMTLGNAKAIDLFAEHDGQTVNVQVKAIARRKNIGWPITKDKIVPGVIYVFVCLNEPPEAPTYFVATADEARAKVKQYAVRGIIDLTTLRSDRFMGRWDKIDSALAPTAHRSVDPKGQRSG